MNILANYKKYFIICVFICIYLTNSEESSIKATTKAAKAPEHDYHLTELIEEELDPDEDDEGNVIPKKKIKHQITIKHVSNVFACIPNWDSLDDCDIIENFK